MVMEDGVQVFDSLFAITTDTNNDEDKPMTLLDIKDNLKDYSPNKLKSHDSVLIDSMNELTKDKKSLKLLKNVRKN